jgi:hypothetical protein
MLWLLVAFLAVERDHEIGVQMDFALGTPSIVETTVTADHRCSPDPTAVDDL